MRINARLATAALAAATLSAATLPTAFAAPANDPDRVKFTKQVSSSGSIADAAVAAVRTAPGQTLDATAALLDSTQASHVRMERSYRGLKVVGGDLVVHRDAKGTITSVSQTLTKPLTLGVTPAVSKAKALSAAKGKKATLLVDATQGTPRLAWQVTSAGVQKDGTPSRLATFVDAQTGAIIRTEQQIQTVGGDGQSLYGGTVPLQLTLSGSTYQMKDPTRGNTYTIDVNNKTDSFVCSLFGSNCATGPVFSGPDTHFGNGSTSSRESAGVDAQYGTDATWDYYKNVHARNGIFGTGKGSFNRVHYGKNYVNAFWDGTKMTYGDGDGTNYGPLTSLDVAGHEMSHGVTENSANLTYSGESGGLNESTSDIFGTMVEFYAANSNDPGDYLIGEEFDLKKHTGLRRMDNPAADGKSANCWTSGVGSLDVHYSSGVGNHFYYLLAEGSGAKTIGGVAHNSTTCNGSSVSGIGRDAAAKIWYRALTVYMTSSTNYKGARTASLNAAKDLYGQGSTQYNAVAAAWSAVNVA